jgi:hypothetical protein
MLRTSEKREANVVLQKYNNSIFKFKPRSNNRKNSHKRSLFPRDQHPRYPHYLLKNPPKTFILPLK